MSSLIICAAEAVERAVAAIRAGARSAATIRDIEIVEYAARLLREIAARAEEDDHDTR